MNIHIPIWIIWVMSIVIPVLIAFCIGWKMGYEKCYIDMNTH